MRAIALSCAAVVSIVLGLGLLVFYIDGRLGGATTLLAGFSIAAVSFTAIVFRERPAADMPDDGDARGLDGHIASERIAPGGEL